MEFREDFPGYMDARELLFSLSRLGEVVVGERYQELREEELNRDDDDSDMLEDDDSTDEEGDEGDPSPVPFQRPSSCSFLFPGRTFAGHQRTKGPNRQREDWAGTATIYSCDFDRGRITGRLTAQTNPSAKRPVVTYFEGEIVDNVNNTFYTGGAASTPRTREVDLDYWTRCPGFMNSMLFTVQEYEGRLPQLGSCQYLFMRWKECFFVDMPQDCTMTITGSYYLSLDRTTGSIAGHYHDSRWSPIQALQLRPLELCGAGGSSGLGETTTATTGSGSGSGDRDGGRARGDDRNGLDFSADATARAVQGLEIPEGMAFGSYRLC